MVVGAVVVEDSSELVTGAEVVVTMDEVVVTGAELVEVVLGRGLSETRGALALNLEAHSARLRPLGQQKVVPVLSWVQ